MKIPRQPKGELADNEQISPEIRANLSDDAQKTFVDTYNRSFREANGKDNALTKAWDRVKQVFDRDEKGTYSRSKVRS
jgi:cation transport regulator ChaB